MHKFVIGLGVFELKVVLQLLSINLALEKNVINNKHHDDGKVQI